MRVQSSLTVQRQAIEAQIANLQDQLRTIAVDLESATGSVRYLFRQGDDRHPVEVAEQFAAALPRATLHVYDRPGVLWTDRADLRERIAGFLND